MNRPGGSRRGSRHAQQQTRAGHELSQAYSSLAAELTQKELKSVGGYTLGRVIGEGSFGKVRIGVHRLTNTRVAIKQVPKSSPVNSSDRGSAASSPLSLLTRELHHHRRLRHPHILALYEIIATESSIYLVTELCTGGELFDYLVEKGRLSASETRRIFGQLVLGVAHLHQSGVVHRDLKLENVLLDERVNVKIADLGFGREFEKGRWMDTWVGTLGYCAPEVVAAKRYHGEEVDIWSLGVILYTLLAGSLPFDDDDEGLMKEMILKCEYDIPTWLDEDAIDLIQNILVLDPMRRLTLKAILAHPFFTRPPPLKLPSEPSYHHLYHHGHRRDASPHTTRDAFPPAIPEEGSATESPLVDESALMASTSSSTGHVNLSASEVSADSSYLSISGSEPERTRSGATTPLTSEEDGLAALQETLTAMNARKAGKQRAVDQDSSDENGVLLHRNASQTTICRNASMLMEDSQSTTSDPIPTPTTRSSKSCTTPLSTADENELTIPAVPSYASLIGLCAPPLQRNLSASSSVSFGSQTGSPAAVHSRTPSRTKRRSVGSTFSERLFPLDEEAPMQLVNYFAMLSEPHPAPLTTPQEQALLDSLTTLGFDTGQIVHSITTHACDSSAAVYWMLKRKADEREREKLESEAAAPVASSPASLPRSLTSSIRRVPSTDVIDEVAGADSATTPPAPTFVSPTTSSQRTGTPENGPPQGEAPQTPDERAQERLSYFLHQTPLSSLSLASFDYFPPAGTNPSPQRRVVHSKSHERNLLADSVESKGTSRSPSPPRVHVPTASPPPMVGRTQSATNETTTVASPDWSKTKRQRSSSTTMLLARATSAIGLKKSTNESGPNDEEDRSDSPAGSTKSPGSFFGRKGSLPSEEMMTPGAGTPSKSAPSSPRRASAGNSLSTPSLSSIMASSTSALEAGGGSTGAALQEVTLDPGSSTMVHSNSHETFSTVTSAAATGEDGSIHDLDRSTSHTAATKAAGKKKGAKAGNLFSNLRLWFGDDRRKATATKRGMPLGRVDSVASTLSRSCSRRSALGSPPITRSAMDGRSSSGEYYRLNFGSTGGTISRRSSVSSVNRSGSMNQSSSLVHRKRLSDTSIATSEPRSRPGSVRSYSYDGSRRVRDRRRSSLSSHGISPKDVAKHQPITTTVHRSRSRANSHHHHHGHTTGTHSRTRSISSVNTRHSSSSSIGGDDVDVGEGVEEPSKGKEPIIEEDESNINDLDSSSGDATATVGPGADEATEEERRSNERNRALRLLSGDTKRRSTGEVSVANSISPRVSLESTRPHTPTRFTAHRTTHLFGAPSQPAATKSKSHESAAPHAQQSSSVSILPRRPPIRDVFVWKEGEEWEDEDDEPSGGFGQAPSSRLANDNSKMAIGTGVARSPSLGGPGLAEMRKFADLPAARPGMTAEQGGAASGGTVGGGRQPYWRRPAGAAPVMIEEEEEED
ncbi:CAMK/CAMKL/MARK protein kinase [Microbotryum lychnidis-dioicae p1A1 Lamole]|uniref:CAMK/CAMKL/MARK protein kinase n=1 Tax=Microbotryum lychnidis-dioicae (strain p1A1 Lamole / MvSl-1064) TaxID=683840 RepID=U5HI54_USTV1|nr:CAMK/CAMKL/MARK protein kinase [Microbotryum lychnidis-dioicae p1A1 Lamole]|eukprot:KDE02753.1 CAMK/CAMKL/MARK protein kinase [Microbotryum lychnidis-dioicae p1A1 Lamole]